MSILLTGIIFISAGTLLVPDRSTDELSDTRTNLALRSIGHQLLLKGGDSVSRVLPVKQVNGSTFQLEFQSAFVFVPDTLVNVIQHYLREAGLPSHYIVKVLNCNNSSQIIYGYEFAEKQNAIIPCSGRSQVLGCYVIQIVFPDDESIIASINPYVWIFTLPMMALIGFVGIKLFRKEKERVIISTGEFTTLGKYAFYDKRRLLCYQNESIELSDKESKLLKIFAANQNEIIGRDRLLKEVWEDDGVFVGRSLDVFVSKLRKKLQGDASLRIVNIHGKGYTLEAR